MTVSTKSAAEKTIAVRKGHRFIFFHRLVAKSPYRHDLKVGILPEPFPQPADMHLQRMRIGTAVHAPDLVHDLTARKDPVRGRHEHIQQEKLLLRQLDRTTFRGNRQCIAVEHGAAHPDLSPADRLTPAEQGFHTPKHFIHVNRLDHIVVRPRAKPFMFIRKTVLRGDDQNRHPVIGFPQRPRQFKAVHTRHHDVGNHQIDIGLFQHVKRCDAVLRREGGIAAALEYRAEQVAQFLIVFHNQNPEHARTSAAFYGTHGILPARRLFIVRAKPQLMLKNVKKPIKMPGLRLS